MGLGPERSSMGKSSSSVEPRNWLQAYCTPSYSLDQNSKAEEPESGEADTESHISLR